MFAGVQGQFPGHTFRRTTGVDRHHSTGRYGWVLLDPEGNPALAGTDVVVAAEDGRLAEVTGFFGDLPALDDE